MKYIIYKNNKFISILDEQPLAVTKGYSIARCETIPTLGFGQYYEVFNIKERIETYTEREKQEVKKTTSSGKDYATFEYIEVEKERTYLTCELRVVDKPNKTQLLEEKQIRDYEDKIVALIRKKYSINQELAILRQRDSKPEEYQEYYDYVEECKATVKAN